MSRHLPVGVQNTRSSIIIQRLYYSYYGEQMGTAQHILYYFDRFGRPVSHGEWPWPKSVGCPASQRRWPSLKGQKIGQIFKISAGRPNSGQVLAEILHLSQGIFKLANAKISATLVPCPTPGRIDRNSTVLPSTIYLEIGIKMPAKNPYCTTSLPK